MPVKNETSKALNDFLTEFQNFASQVTEAALHHAQDEDEKAVINAFAPAFLNQTKELSNYVLAQSSVVSRQQSADADQVLKVSSGATLAKGAKGLFPSIGSIIGKLGLDRILKELKKIIKAILKAFGIKLPKWLDAIINLIDEILAAILSGGSSKVSTILSEQEVLYLKEITELEKLEKASALNNDMEEADD